MIATKTACAMSFGEFVDEMTTLHRCVLPCFPVVSPLPSLVMELARLTLMQSIAMCIKVIPNLRDSSRNKAPW